MYYFYSTVVCNISIEVAHMFKNWKKSKCLLSYLSTCYVSLSINKEMSSNQGLYVEKADYIIRNKSRSEVDYILSHLKNVGERTICLYLSILTVCVINYLCLHKT